MFNKVITLSLTLLLNVVVISSVAQTIPVGAPIIEDAYRRAQLLGKLDSNVSFTIRPISPMAAFKKVNPYITGLNDSLEGNNGMYKTADGKGFLQLLPLVWQQQYNSHNPYGWNDGAMIPAAGYQTLISAGFFVRYKFLSIQFKPEFVYAQNRNFDGFTQANNEANVWTNYYGVYNNIDLPERFGTRPYSKMFPGQSSFRLTFDPVSIGVSTENLWWGPGIRNSLIMSNTSSGFLHATLNTTRPVSTPIGHFEAQLIGGKLEGSGQPPLVLGQVNGRDNLYKPKINDWRYFSGFVVSYHPKWVPGFFLGLTRAYQAYQSDVSRSFSGYFPVFSGFSKLSSYDIETGKSSEDTQKRDQVTSIFGRYLWTEAKAEIYFEFGKNDHNWNLRDLFLDPEHASAYTLGFKKLYATGTKPNQYIQIGFEATQLAGGTNDVVNRGGGQWYTHSAIRDGYTNNGQPLGAGIGPGGNLQSLDISWFRGLKKFGIMIERYEHNADFFARTFNKGELRRHWADINVGLSTDWDYKRLLVSGKLLYTKQFNYQWQLKDDPKIFYWNYNQYDATNVQLALSATYRF